LCEIKYQDSIIKAEHRDSLLLSLVLRKRSTQAKAIQSQPRQKHYQDPNSISKFGMVVYICDPSYIGGIDRMIIVQGWPGAKNVRPYLKNNLKQKRLERLVSSGRAPA
jgi:hypothetical protein